MKIVQLNRKTIVVHDDLYQELKRLGTLTESFNDVIWKLVERATSGQSSLQGRTGQTAARTDRSHQEAQNGEP